MCSAFEERDGGTFALSPECDNDPVATRELLRLEGREAAAVLLSEARDVPAPADAALLLRIHGLWFQRAFPLQGGKLRDVDVVSRRGIVSARAAVAADLHAAFHGFEEDWVAAGGDRTVKRFTSKSELAQLIHLANRITVRAHYVHPFIDGNTRACFLLRRYLLQRAGLPPVPGDLREQRQRAAWNAANQVDHDELDQVLYDDLSDALLELP